MNDLGDVQSGVQAVQVSLADPPVWIWFAAAVVGPGLVWSRADDLTQVVGVGLVLAVASGFIALEIADRRSARSVNARPRNRGFSSPAWVVAFSFAVAIGVALGLNLETADGLLQPALTSYLWIAFVPQIVWRLHARSVRVNEFA